MHLNTVKQGHPLLTTFLSSHCYRVCPLCRGDVCEVASWRPWALPSLLAAPTDRASSPAAPWFGQATATDRPSTWTDDTARAYQLWLSPCRRELLNPATDASLFLSSTFKDFVYSFCSLPVYDNLYIFINSRFKILFSLMKRSYLVQVNESQHPSAFLFMLRIAERGLIF